MAHDYKHAATHTDGSTDQIQDATSGQKGLATDTQISKLDGIEALADVTDSTNVNSAGAVMHTDISEAEGFLRKSGSETYVAIKSNLAASVAPTVNEDSGDGYTVGSTWIDTTADKAYLCLDATVAAAVWTEITQSGGGGGDMTAGDPKLAIAESSSTSYADVVNVSGSGYFFGVVGCGSGGSSTGQFQITIDGGTTLTTNPITVEGDTESAGWPAGFLETTGGVSISGGGAAVRFDTSLLVQHKRTSGTVAFRSMASYTLDQ